MNYTIKSLNLRLCWAQFTARLEVQSSIARHYKILVDLITLMTSRSTLMLILLFYFFIIRLIQFHLKKWKRTSNKRFLEFLKVRKQWSESRIQIFTSIRNVLVSFFSHAFCVSHSKECSQSHCSLIHPCRMNTQRGGSGMLVLPPTSHIHP